MRELRARAYEEASSVALAAEVYALETVTAAEEYAAGMHGTDLTALRAAAAAAVAAAADVVDSVDIADSADSAHAADSADFAHAAGSADSGLDDITELTGVGAAAGAEPPERVGGRHAKNNMKSRQGDPITNTPRSPEPSELEENATGHHGGGQGPQHNQKGAPAPATADSDAASSAASGTPAGRDPVDEAPLVGAVADTPGTDTPGDRVSS
jgi:hypothetical protein